MENERNGGRMSVRRKFANMLEYFNPFSTMPPPQEDEAAPAAKRRRLQTSTSSSKAVDAAESDIFLDAQTYRYMADDALTASPDDTVAVAPVDAVTASASLPSARASSAPRRNWKPEEDTKLTEAVTKHGNNWAAVAALVPGRSNAQSRKRWNYSLDPDINSDKWTVEEDATLTEAVTNLGDDWVRVAMLVPGRTNLQCRNRWINNLDAFAYKLRVNGQWKKTQS
jgi:hypothetical protein